VWETENITQYGSVLLIAALFFFFFFLGATARSRLWPPSHFEGFVTIIVLQGGVVNPTPNPQLF
jgi:hypothetical protein